jgi:RES domain-containing protein
MQLVRDSKAAMVMNHIDAVDAGLHSCHRMRFTGLLCRALNPIHARNPRAGQGARRHSARFDPKGMPAPYTAQSVMTAIREANQIGTLQPTTPVT